MALRAAVRPTEPKIFRFADDGKIPNNSALPFLVYQGAVNCADADDPAAVFEAVFPQNGWTDSWRNGVFPFVHYHSAIHEVLGIARGRARVRFGGDRGEELNVAAGDVAVLPAGTGHQRLSASDDFLVVGAYPGEGAYDLCRGLAAERERALVSIPKVPVPKKDPLFGADGPLITHWTER